MTYCTVADVKATTRNTELKAESTTVITSLIEQAELIIDQYVGFVKSPKSQALKFPLTGESTIPTNVKYATIYQVEYMFENDADLEHGISDETGDKNTKGNKFNVVSHRAKQLLAETRTIVGKPYTIVDYELLY